MNDCKFNIRIVAKESNVRGDLFCRLMADLCLALGYDQPKYNVQKSGREIDIQAIHRLEKKRIIAECKAMEEKVGGGAINKFVGALDAERRKNPAIQTVGYFISLSGFKPTALEQESEAGGDRLVLLDGNGVVEQLIASTIIVPIEKAMEKAGRCVRKEQIELIPEESFELLAHNNGWHWLIFYGKNKERTHFSLVHADGTVIAEKLAKHIINEDINLKSQDLNYVGPSNEANFDYNNVQKAREKYYQYLVSECGEIQLDGLPIDHEIGPRRLKLENIFVPMYLVDMNKNVQFEKQTVGEVLQTCSKLAILAGPGGGKSTLIKRLAIAYSHPERKAAVKDRLPEKNWVPLFIRCRQLGELAKSSIIEVITAIAKKAELGELQNEFKIVINDALRQGNAFLLIDGLDEIADISTRSGFIQQMRTFLAIYPNISIVVTSREAGFRVIGGTLSSVCKHYQLADFDSEDVERLTIAWHKEVVGDRPEVMEEAQKLAALITYNDRIRELAVNPLLLTTLLLVKRWVGQLPTKRSVLYEKAIEVLLMTWNTAGYEPLNQEEVVPQLSFVAYQMMKDGVQQISRKRLIELLELARKQMPSILGYTNLSSSQFIEAVERRSSLLILSGHRVEDGRITPVYEFQHLTFQEFLAASAIVDGFYPNYCNDSIENLLAPFIYDEYWSEVISLAAVLAGGRKIQPFVELLIDKCKTAPSISGDIRSVYEATLLQKLILDEVQLSPNNMKAAIEWIAKIDFLDHLTDRSGIEPLLNGRFKDVVIQTVREAYRTSNTHILNLGKALADVTRKQVGIEFNNVNLELVAKIKALVEDNDPLNRSAGCVILMNISYQAKSSDPIDSLTLEKLLQLSKKIWTLLYTDEPLVQCAACWALNWGIANLGWSPDHNKKHLEFLIDQWKNSSIDTMRYLAAWNISLTPILERSEITLTNIDEDTNLFLKNKIQSSIQFEKLAVILLGYYLTAWTDNELVELIQECSGFQNSREHQLLLNLLQRLNGGDAEAINKLNANFIRYASEREHNV